MLVLYGRLGCGELCDGDETTKGLENLREDEFRVAIRGEFELLLLERVLTFHERRAT